MREKPLDELYFTWLYGQVGSVEIRNPSKTYWKLFKHLFTKEFVWIIPNDDNRAEDGRDLRYEFIDDHPKLNGRVPADWMDIGCSMLELLIGLSRRLAFEGEGEPRSWFWVLIENLGLENCNDNAVIPDDDIDDILDQVIWRTYNRNGSGGLFPLKRAAADQREIELWYQMSAYLLERA